MSDGGPAVKLGADCFSQHTDWQSYLKAMTQAEKLSYDSLGFGAPSLPASR